MSLTQLKFMSACGQSTHKVNFAQIELYQELIREEVVKELFPALDEWHKDPMNPEKIRAVLDGAGDTMVVVEGLLWSMGVDPQNVKAIIDTSNFTKIPERGNQVLRREDGKILKPSHFKEPELGVVVKEVLDRMSTVLG